MTVMLACLLGLSMLTPHVFTLSLKTPDGLVNPTLHLELIPGRRDEFLACLLATVISGYFYAVVAWTDGKLHRLREEVVGDAPEFRVAQPLEVLALKDAIRLADLPAIQRLATESALAYMDEHFMTPMELAELYGRDDVIRALQQAAQPKSGPRFGIRARRV